MNTSNPLTNTEMLFIRACKSSDPYKRVRSVYRRFYYGGKSSDVFINFVITQLFANICDKHMPISSSDLISKVNPNQACNFGNSYDVICFRALINHIRLIEVSKIPGFKIPLRFRRND